MFWGRAASAGRRRGTNRYPYGPALITADMDRTEEVADRTGSEAGADGATPMQEAGDGATSVRTDGGTGESSVVDEDLYQRTMALLEPGEIELVGAIVHTDLEGQADIEMMNASLEVGDVIAEGAGHDPGDVYVYSGNDDSDFSSNQHQGKTIDDDEFVWECQQLLRNGSFDLVFYYEASTDQEWVVDELRERGYRVQPAP